MCTNTPDLTPSPPLPSLIYLPLLIPPLHIQQVTQRNVIRLFLTYREANLQDRSVWESILEENFVFTLPITPYR